MMKQKPWLAVSLTAIGIIAVALSFDAVAQNTAQAQADQYERRLAGIRLNSKASAVLKSYGNPNQVVIGDIGPRESPASAGGQGTPGQGVGTPGGRGGGLQPGGFGRGGVGGPPTGFGGPPPGFGGGGPPAGFGGPPPGFGGGGEEDGGRGGAPGGFGGAPGFGSAGGGGAVGAFGRTTSTLTPQQETTWVYNRRAGKDVISYEFLIGQGGAVTQIRTIGYAGGNIKTNKGVQLGTTYKEVVLRYGVPEQQFRLGRTLIAQYRNKYHAQFQFLNQRSQQENPFSEGNKVISMTIASVE